MKDYLMHSYNRQLENIKDIRMKKLSVIAVLIISGITILAGCGNGIKRNPGKVYMPDMFYSRAYETYVEMDSTLFTTDSNQAGRKIFYNNLPVRGTVSRAGEYIFPIPKDAIGDSTNYVASKAVQNPEPPLTQAEYDQMHRLYLINCGICHGAKLDGNGPLYNGGNGPFIAAPKNLAGDPAMIAMPDGQMFYSVTYGKNTMGSYASQLTTKQRWQLIHYIKMVQKGTGSSSSTPAADSAAIAAK